MGDSGWHDTLDVDSSSRQILMRHILDLHLLLDCRPSTGRTKGRDKTATRTNGRRPGTCSGPVSTKRFQWMCLCVQRGSKGR